MSGSIKDGPAYVIICLFCFNYRIHLSFCLRFCNGKSRWVFIALLCFFLILMMLNY